MITEVKQAKLRVKGQGNVPLPQGWAELRSYKGTGKHPGRGELESKSQSFKSRKKPQCFGKQRKILAVERLSFQRNLQIYFENRPIGAFHFGININDTGTPNECL